MLEPYQDILARAGFPTDVLVLDWETYFAQDYSLRQKEMDNVQFVGDARFEITGLGHATHEPARVGFERPGSVKSYLLYLQDAFGENLERCTVVGHNLYFDLLILREKYGITPKYTVDIRDLSRHLDARDRHDLDHLAKKYGAPTPKGDTNQFKGLHAADMTDQQWADLSEYCRNDIDITAFLLKKLLPMITRPEIELRLAAQTLRMFLVPNIVVDAELGERLITDMSTEIGNVIEATHEHGILSCQPPFIGKRVTRPPVIRQIEAEDISKNALLINLFKQVLPEGEAVPMKQGKKEMIPAFKKDDDGFKWLLEHPSPAVRALAEARLAVKSWPSHIKRVQRIMAQAQCRGGLLGIPLNYYGGHTGRWSGAGGINAQNFGARDVHDLIKDVGKMLLAPPGHLMGTGDLRQIEARDIAWLSGQTDLVDAFAAGIDIYSEFAQNNIFHEETRKPTKEEWESNPELAKQLTIRRDFGKEVVLGAGFSMWGNTFYIRCRQVKSLRPLFDAGTYDVSFCIKLIKLYRNRYKMVVAFWGELERAFRFVTKYKDQTTTVSHNGHDLVFLNQDDTTVIMLPSGRCIFYPMARVAANGDLSYTSGKTKYYLYGGKLAENVVQASARDVFGEGLLRLEDAGFPVLFSIHDAAITLIKNDGQAEERLAEMHRLQLVVPDWATGLPVATEGRLCDRFEK